MKIKCRRSELNLKCTLSGGQCFRWREINGKWIGVIAQNVWILYQDEDFLFYEVFPSAQKARDEKSPSAEPVAKRQKIRNYDNLKEKYELLLRNYFRMDDLDLSDAYRKWSSSDEHFANVCSNFQGIRILNQDPVENLFSFICSSNNNITRISSMIQRMCNLFGEEIACVNDEKYFSFPNISSLTKLDVESQLRSSGFGYRSRFIHQTAEKLQELGGRKWLEDLKKGSYEEARNQLISLPGVGTKVADCVCLMSLGFLEAVPVDTHIFHVAAQWYMPSLRKSKTVTPRIHREVGDFFRNLYGPYAGWAHTILFCSNLKMFDSLSKLSPDSPKGRINKTI